MSRGGSFVMFDSDNAVCGYGPNHSLTFSLRLFVLTVLTALTRRQCQCNTGATDGEILTTLSLSRYTHLSSPVTIAALDETRNVSQPPASPFATALYCIVCTMYGMVYLSSVGLLTRSRPRRALSLRYNQLGGSEGCDADLYGTVPEGKGPWPPSP